MRSRKAKDIICRVFIVVSAVFSASILVGILGLLVSNAARFIALEPLDDFLFGTVWRPSENQTETHYGVLPLVVSSLLVTIGSMAIAIPLGIMTAIYLAGYAPKRLRWKLKAAIELLAALPSVVVGFLGIVLVSPILTNILPIHTGLNALNGSILLSIMALPTIITLSEDALHSIPQSIREAAFAVGAKKWDTLFKIVLPAAYPGILSAIMLGMGRAVGETMTVLMATGNASAFPHGFLDSVRTITATIAIEMGEVPHGTKHYYSLYSLALILFIMTFSVNLFAEHISSKIKKFR